MELETVKSRMEAARFVAVHVWNSAGKSMKRGQFDPHKLLPFPWDYKAPKPKQSVQQLKSTMMGIALSQNRKIDKHGSRTR